MGERGADLFGLVSHHHDDVPGRRDPEGGLNHVLDKRQAAGAVQHLGASALHSRAEAGSEYDDTGLHVLFDYPIGAAID
jgi:hypothetical protein